jgi:hypothetical protein
MYKKIKEVEFNYTDINLLFKILNKYESMPTRSNVKILKKVYIGTPNTLKIKIWKKH